ncbi:MAG: RnfABCDGE type electron transport complex subunit D [Cyclobacteriaceae bacterium]
MSDILLKVAPSPHVHQPLTIPQVMRGVIIAMIPALLLSFISFGLGAVTVTLTAVISCMFFEFIISKYLLKQTDTLWDGSAALTGILLAFNVPAGLPWHIVVIGSAVAMGIGKLSFGGLGNNPFNPALVGRVFMLVSFPVEMTKWPVSKMSGVDGTTAATPLGLLKEGLREGQSVPELMQQLPSLQDLLIGFHGGSMGEMSAIAILVGLAYMMYKKIITWHVPISIITTVLVFSGIFWLIDPSQYANPVFHILSGGVMLGAVFMATDYVTSPGSTKGMLIFGFFIGLITVIIRLFGAYPEGISFAILIMNAFVPLIDKYTKPRKFGTKQATS